MREPVKDRQAPAVPMTPALVSSLRRIRHAFVRIGCDEPYQTPTYRHAYGCKSWCEWWETYHDLVAPEIARLLEEVTAAAKPCALCIAEAAAEGDDLRTFP
jgi:hypothetical protein